MNPSTPLPTPEGPGSASGAPNLPAGFTDTFASRYVNAGGLRQHVVIGGDGPPLLLVHGWPETWYAWRMVMPALARDFQVIAVDQRGIGLSDKPQDGYDTGTLANDLVALMDALGHRRFAMYGTDTGMPIGYALAADHPDRLDRLVVSEAPLPGVTPSPPLIGTAQANEQLWHIPFNRVDAVNGQGTRGHLLQLAATRAARGHRHVLRRHPPVRPVRAARQLRAVPRVRRHYRTVLQRRRKSRNALLSSSWCVHPMLCGPSGTSTTVRSAMSRSSRRRAAVASNGRMRSAVPCTTNVGTSIFGRSPRKSVNHESTHA